MTLLEQRYTHKRKNWVKGVVDMQISVLREFLALSEVLNFSHVSKSFYISQSALSKHIDALENEIGVKLFVRDKHSVRLTQMGRIFSKDIKSVMNRYDNAIENLSNVKMGFEQTLKVGYLYGAARTFLADTSATFEKKYPHTQLKLYAEEAGSLLPLLKNNKLDMIIDMKLPGEDYSNFHFVNLYKDCLGAAVSKHHRLAKRGDILLQDLAHERVLVPGRDTMSNVHNFYRKVLCDQLFWKNAEELIHDINSPRTYLQNNAGVFITFHHLKSYYGDDATFLPIRGIESSFSIAAIWKMAQENESIRGFANILAQVTQARRTQLEEGIL